MAEPYLTLNEFKQLALMPASFVDEVETQSPGFTMKQIELTSARINSRLSKRYDTPFGHPAPIAVQGWVVNLVQPSIELKRGVGPESSNIDEYKRLAQETVAEIKEAADAESGLFDLPLRGDTDATGIARGAALVYTETSPYVQADVQAELAHEEDRTRYGSRR